MEEEIRDTDPHNSEDINMVHNEKTLLYFSNTHDEPVTVEIKGAAVSDFQDKYTVLLGSFTLGAGDVNVTTKVETVTQPHAALRAVVTAQGVPTVGKVELFESSQRKWGMT